MRFSVYILVLSSLLHFFGCAAQRTCENNDLEFAYTKCSSNTRWRVQVPKEGAGCQAKSVAPPTMTRTCNSTCGPGQRLDISSDSCQPCPLGTFSVGSGFRWDTWKEMPEGFNVELMAYDRDGENGCKKNSGWQPMGEFLGGHTSTNCMVQLSRSVMATSESKLTFRIQNSDEHAYFSFSVKKCDCEGEKSAELIMLLPSTADASVQTKTINLKPGLNKLEWTMVPAETAQETSSNYPVRLLSVEVAGLSSFTDCQPCRPGHSSEIGSSSCHPCPPDQFSPDGRPCAPCPSGQFSREGSSKCKPRPKCSETDYQASYSSCSSSSSRQLQYSWILPKICDDSAADSAKLPPAKPATSCGARCSPGQRVLAGTRPGCEFCPEGSHSADGNSSVCQQCPKNTQPVPAFVATRWLSLPPLTNVSCLPASTDSASECSSSGSNEMSGWLLMGEYLQTANNHLPHLRQLSVKFPGFAPVDSDSSVFSFEFEMQCRLQCKLMLVRKLESRHELIRTWTGTKKKHTFSYYIRSTDEHNFVLYFNPASGDEASKPDSGVGNYLRIFTMNATNVIGAGAVKCKPCPMGVDGQGCAQCKSGHYFNSASSACQPCPNGTVSPAHQDSGHCRPCPPGLRPAAGAASCELNPLLQLADGKMFNLTKLATRSWQVAGGRLFSWKGTRYQHLFNISLGGGATCSSNGSRSISSRSKVTGSVCRSTLIPSSAADSESTTLLPMQIGIRLANVTPTASGGSRVAELLSAGGWPAEPDGYELQAFFESDSATKSCPTGRTALLTLRCSASHAQPQLQLPPKCPDGTCDGCVFHFMLLAQLACPLCRIDDYERVKGECVMGKQIVHLYPAKHCYLSGSQPTKKTLTESCPLVSQPVAMLVLLVLIAGAACLLLACHCYRTNKRLQYQYTQLVEAKEGCELPGVESCAVQESDEDEEDLDDSKRMGGGRSGGDQVRFQSMPALSRLRKSLMPFGNRSRSRRKGDSVEHLDLNGDDMDDLGM